MPEALLFSDNKKLGETKVGTMSEESKNNSLWSTAKKHERWVVIEPPRGIIFEGCPKSTLPEAKNIRLENTMEQILNNIQRQQ